jgi:hypothetical protein
MDAGPLPDYSGVVVIEQDNTYESRNNAVIYNADGSERVRLTNDFGSFCNVSHENQLGLIVSNGFTERWYAVDHVAGKLGAWHPLK